MALTVKDPRRAHEADKKVYNRLRSFKSMLELLAFVWEIDACTKKVVSEFLSIATETHF